MLVQAKGVGVDWAKPPSSAGASHTAVSAKKLVDYLGAGFAFADCEAAIADAGLEKGDIQAAWMSNAAAGVLTGQECIRGQVVLRGIGMGELPVVNVENACASASTAFNQACAMVTAGVYDVVLACGVEKMYFEDKAKVLLAQARAHRELSTSLAHGDA